MMDYQLRVATTDDAPGMLETQVGAFRDEEGTLRWERARSYCFDHTEEHVVMVDEGDRVVGLVHIGDHAIQVGTCAVRKADVGHVGVRPELQGQGIGTRMMQKTAGWLREQGYHLSRLGGLTHFYSRFGYEPFPRRFVEIDLQSVRGGGRGIPGSEIYEDPGEWPGRVRPYDPSRDFEDRARLRWEYDHGRSGALVCSPDAEPPRHPAPPDPGGLHWVYEHEGEVLGHLHAVEAPLEPGEETVFTLADFAYAPDFPDAAGALVRKLLSRVCQHGPARVTSRIPFDEAVAEALQLAGVAHRRVEMYQAVASNMILVLDLASTLEAVAAELSRRISDSLVADWSGAIELSFPTRGTYRIDDPTQATAGDELPGEACRLVVDDGEVSVDAGPGPADLQIELSQAQFVKSLFGIAALGDLPCMRGIDLSPTWRGVIDALFPRLQAGSGPWG
ncbi:MAG: GNAT family N-acetyltransferase [Armatimonadota bacterium]